LVSGQGRDDLSKDIEALAALLHPLNIFRNYSPVIPAQAGIHPDGPAVVPMRAKIHPDEGQSRLPDGFLLAQE
jgi:hypothetical protein